MRTERLVLVGLVFLFLPTAFADTGPKPGMDFTIRYNTSTNVTLIGGEQYQCADQNCSTSTPLGKLGPQRFSCSENSCQSVAYNYLDYQRLVLNFSDKARVSNVFKTQDPGSYDVLVTDSGLLVTWSPARSPWFDAIPALMITTVIEVLVATTYLTITRTSKRILLSVLVANLISVPALWTAAIFLGVPGYTFLLGAEFLVIILEAYFIHYANKASITLKRSFVLSTLMNLASAILGGIILYMLW